MKKIMFLLFILLALPTASWSQGLDNNTVKEITSKIEHQTDRAGRNFEQAFEDFKNDPIGQTKEYFIEAKNFFFHMVDLIKNAFEELKKKFA